MSFVVFYRRVFTTLFRLVSLIRVRPLGILEDTVGLGGPGVSIPASENVEQPCFQ